MLFVAITVNLSPGVPLSFSFAVSNLHSDIVNVLLSQVLPVNWHLYLRMHLLQVQMFVKNSSQGIVYPWKRHIISACVCGVFDNFGNQYPEEQHSWWLRHTFEVKLPHPPCCLGAHRVGWPSYYLFCENFSTGSKVSVIAVPGQSS